MKKKVEWRKISKLGTETAGPFTAGKTKAYDAHLTARAARNRTHHDPPGALKPATRS